ncbi:MAG: hypothetical protein HZB19_11040 [Chloroflexi bacterium]|nr:hypothetical protein [Chloroflexota bacterium]
MKQDRFLTGILIGIGVLVVLALALFFTRQDKRDYLAEDTPEGVAYNYVLAVVNKDYEKAYGYLADLKNKPTYEQFRQSFFNGEVNPGNVGVDVGTADINDDEAFVELTLVYSPSDPFSNGYQNTDRALLVKQDGDWKISAMPTGYLWGYNWYQEPFKP